MTFNIKDDKILSAERLDQIATGDMPGDKIDINVSHVSNTKKIFPILLESINSILEDRDTRKVVISVYGGSGVGKSETGALIAHFLKLEGINSYILSGDNYPKRIPLYNDAERLGEYRYHGVKALAEVGILTTEISGILKIIQSQGKDSDPHQIVDYPWLRIYQEAGKKALINYLGSPMEINFGEVNEIIHKFKKGVALINLKRMGRSETELWYETVDLSKISVLIIEWTHGNNENLEGIDIPIFLNSTPEQTLEHRKKRARDGGVDSSFTTLVLGIEQEKLHRQAKKAKLIVTKDGDIISYRTYLNFMNIEEKSIATVLNVYPDSIGNNVSSLIRLLETSEFENAFSSIYMLPSIFNTDLDRGFSIIDYSLNELFVTKEELEYINDLGIDFKFDVVMNHGSVLSSEFQDIIKNGSKSRYIDFFIDWNKFWDGKGEMTEAGYIQPKAELIENMFFRKPGLPILEVRTQTGEKMFFWNTFYQSYIYSKIDVWTLTKKCQIQYGIAAQICEIVNSAIEKGIMPNDIQFGTFEVYKESIVKLLEDERKYLGQMDFNIQSPLVWEYYETIIQQLATYGAKVLRLDAFAYVSKIAGRRNFFNTAETWDILQRFNTLAQNYDIQLLPEIHSSYEEKIHESISDRGYTTYDFFLPGLILDAFEHQSFQYLHQWIKEILDKNLKTQNMLGCHDGIPLLDLKGLLPEERIESLIETVVSRGGLVKDLHGQKNVYYQVNATYFSALGEDANRMLLARAIQIFMPGIPQIWYLDLFAGKNDYQEVEKQGASGHKEINRTNLTLENSLRLLKEGVVNKQLNLLKFRNTCKAFSSEASIQSTIINEKRLVIEWENDNCQAVLTADLTDYTFQIRINGDILDYGK